MTTTRTHQVALTIANASPDNLDDTAELLKLVIAHWQYRADRRESETQSTAPLLRGIDGGLSQSAQTEN